MHIEENRGEGAQEIPPNPLRLDQGDNPVYTNSHDSHMLRGKQERESWVQIELQGECWRDIERGRRLVGV